jgi:SAM-dependent methyltransferase/glycosyltransferase involved in cell wall biosynthesis
MLEFTGERIVPGAANCEPLFAEKMYVEHSARYLLAAQLASGARVLDVGCGVGYGSRLLAEAGAREVIAFDLSAEAIEHAKANFAHPALRFQTGDATNFAFDGQFDLITCFELIEHVPDQEAVFRCIAEALAPDGVLVMSSPRALEQKRNEFHTHEFTEAEFRAAFARHFPHHRLMVENNHFTSLVTDGKPEALDRIHPLHDQFGLGEADYLIGLATKGDPARLLLPRPVMVMGNEAYIKLLERDEAILQRRRIELEAEVSSLRGALDAAQQDARAARNEAGAAREEAHATRLEADRRLTQLRDAHQMEQESGSRTQRELAAQIEAMRVSVSWRITGPLRIVSRRLQASIPAFGRAMEFRRRFGLRAMAKRVATVMTRRITGRPVPPTQITDLVGAQNLVAPPAIIPRRRTGPQPDIIFFIGCWEGESKRYRVDNVAETLRAGGRRVEVMSYADLCRLVDEHLTPSAIVLFRAPEEPWTEACLAYARKHGIRVFFDVDDLVFEPSLVERVHGYQLLSEAEKQTYRDGVARYRALLTKCDAVTVSTAPLADAVKALGLPVHVVPNSWNHIQAEIAEKLVAAPRPARDTVVVGYFSGSRTHDRDFQEAAPALLRLMRALPEMRLRLVGELEPGPGFADFAARTERLPFMPYQDMLRAMGECDIVIAPLEPGNPFNEAKSELKWFEAALVETPCVATPTAPFRAAISQGETGFLATTEAEWHDALHALATQPALRARIGAAARQAALDAFGPQRLRQAAEAAFALPGPTAPAIRTEPGRKRIDWIVPGLIIGGGGHRNILRAAHFLERFGHDVGLTFTNIEHSADEIRELLHRHFYPFAGEVRRYDGVFRYSDALFATHWTTVDAALRARGLTKEIMYFVQDFEPMFAPMGTEYILAENTYRQGLYCITSGPWCEVLLKREFGAEADHFEFPIDRDVYFPRQRTRHTPNVLYFAKPEMPRRCYELGVMMLREFHRLAPEVEIIMYGSRNVDLATLGFPATLQGVLPTINDLAQAYANADVGIAFSTTNPSLVPYEMMACGTPVLDLGRPGNEVNYGGRFDVALLADPEPSRMARKLRDLVRNPTERAARSKAGIDLVARMPTEEQMARRVEELILRRLAR